MLNQYEHYTRFGAEFTSNGYKAPRRSLTSGERHVLAIYKLLKDGKWHTASEVMQVTGSKSKQHTRNFLRSLMTPLGLASGQQGYCMVNQNSILVV
jgi:hypothetical protein